MEKWLLISNCQTLGLANSMQLLCPSISVDRIDIFQYREHMAHFNGMLDEYDRVLVIPEVEGSAGADFSRARHISRIPDVYFCGYHPDLAYATAGAEVVNGPLGPYHSIIALAAYQRGLSTAQTIPLYNGRFFEACGFMDQWIPHRDRFVEYFAGHELDITAALRRWASDGVFMYSINHPRIGCLFDIAKLYLRREGYDVVDTDILPHDNLVNSACFPVYPELGEALGVKGSYGFKRNAEYRQLGLEAFVSESFQAFDRYDASMLSPWDRAAETHARVSALLE